MKKHINIITIFMLSLALLSGCSHKENNSTENESTNNISSEGMSDTSTIALGKDIENDLNEESITANTTELDMKKITDEANGYAVAASDALNSIYDKLMEDYEYKHMVYYWKNVDSKYSYDYTAENIYNKTPYIPESFMVPWIENAVEKYDTKYPSVVARLYLSEMVDEYKASIKWDEELAQLYSTAKENIKSLDDLGIETPYISALKQYYYDLSAFNKSIEVLTYTALGDIISEFTNDVYKYQAELDYYLA